MNDLVQPEGSGALVAQNLEGRQYVGPLRGNRSHPGERFATAGPEDLTEEKDILTREDPRSSGRRACGQQ